MLKQRLRGRVPMLGIISIEAAFHFHGSRERELQSVTQFRLLSLRGSTAVFSISRCSTLTVSPYIPSHLTISPG